MVTLMRRASAPQTPPAGPEAQVAPRCARIIASPAATARKVPVASPSGLPDAESRCSSRGVAVSGASQRLVGVPCSRTVTSVPGRTVTPRVVSSTTIVEGAVLAAAVTGRPGWPRTAAEAVVHPLGTTVPSRLAAARVPTLRAAATDLEGWMVVGVLRCMTLSTTDSAESLRSAVLPVGGVDGGEVEPTMTAHDALVRAARAPDVERIRSIYEHYVVATAVSFEEVPPDAAEIGRRMRARPRLPWLVVETGGQVAGYAYASPYHRRPAYRWTADCSVYVDRAHRSRGLGRRLYERLIAEVRDLGYVILVAAITLPNGASVHLHESMGFEALGTLRHAGHKHGGWHDVGWWQLALREPPPSPPEPHQWAPPAGDDGLR